MFHYYLSFYISLCFQFSLFYLLIKSWNLDDLFLRIFLLILNINFSMQIFIPSALILFFNAEYESFFNVSSSYYFKVIIFHILFHFIFLLTFYTPINLFKINGGEKENIYCAKILNIVSYSYKRYIFLLSLIGFYILVNDILSFNISSLLDENLNPSDLSSSQTFDIYIKTIFEWTALISSFIVLFYNDSDKFKKVIVSLFLFVFLFKQLALGLRGGIFIFLIMFLLVAVFAKLKLRILPLAVPVIILIPIFGYLAGDFRAEIVRGELANQGIIQRISMLKNGYVSFLKNGNKPKEDSFLYALYVRLEAPRNSVSIIKVVDEDKTVRLKPTISSLLSFIPQRFTNVSRYPASSTSDKFGTAMHVVREKTYGYTDMGPFLASSHEYWEGYIYFFIFSAIFQGLLWRHLYVLSNIPKYLPFAILVFGLFLDSHHGEMSILAPFSLVIRMFIFQLLPLLIILFSFYLFEKLFSNKKFL